jgi:long-chain acyl-CoA synthetase
MASLALIRSRPGAYTAEEEAAVVARSKLQLSIRLPPDPARPGKSGILRNPSTPNGPADYVSVAQNDPIKTVWQAWLAGVEAAGNGSGPCFGTRVPNGPYTWESYGDVHRRALALGTSLRRKCGLQPGSESSFVGIQLPNGSAWYSVDVACIAMNIVTLPLYTSADDDFSQHIITLGSLSVVFTAAVNVQQMVRLKKAGRVPTLKHIVVAGEPAKPREIEEGTAAGLVFHDYERLIAEGSVNPLPPAPATDPQAMFSIISTSGTTGTPKVSSVVSIHVHVLTKWLPQSGLGPTTLQHALDHAYRR